MAAFWLLLLCCVHTVVAQDRAALIDIYNALNGTTWSASQSANWTSSNSICSWAGVTCDYTNSFVSELTLSGLPGSGTLSPSFSKLSKLNTLNLDFTRWTGSLPTFSNTFLGLSSAFSNLGSDFQSSMCNLPASIFSLDISNNALTMLPDCIINYTALSYIDVGNNQLTHVPPGLFNMAATSLLLYNNRLSGELPTINKKDYYTLNLTNNNFTGCAPDTSQWSDLFKYDISNNKLTGVPIFSSLTTYNQTTRNIFMLPANFMSGNNLFGYPMPYPFQNQTSKANPCMPTVTSVTPVPTAGGVATVTGKYFGTVSPYGGTDNSFTTTYNNGE